MIFFAAALLGVVAGLRTFTAPAVLLLMRAASWPAYVLGVLAIGEYAGDLHPSAPARTRAGPLIARIVSGAFCGWTVASMNRAPAIAGAVAGVTGSLVGAFGGLRLRTLAVERIGRVPAAILEDVVAIVVAVAVVAAA